MPELLIDFITSLDGYAAADGWPGWWGLEGPEYLAWLGEQPEADYTVLMGATTYRLMLGFAANGEPGTDALAGMPKVVFSATLSEPLSWPNTQLVAQDPVAAVRELRRAVRELGFRALRVLPWLWNLPPDDRRYYPLYAECVELDIPFCLQVGHTGPLAPSEPGRPIPYLDHVALEFPDLRIVGGHIGFPWTTEMISLATKYPNVYIDTSAYKVSRYPKEFVDYLRAHGRKKVLFGSNYPAWPAKDCLVDFGALNLDDETAALFLFENAARVFKIQ